MIPYDTITESADRRWTARLVERLVAPGLEADELEALAAALGVLADPRAVGPLEAVVLDPARPEAVRQAAVDALQHSDGWYRAPDDAVRRWWASGDPVLRLHALWSMDELCCPDLLLAAAADPADPLQALAFGQMLWSFDTPEAVAVKRAGLSHPDPAVRRAAADSLLVDQPVAAEADLVAAAGDPDPGVAAQAIHLLRYYPTRAVVRRLHTLRDHADADIRDEAGNAFLGVRQSCRFALYSHDPRREEHVRRWLEPVWDLLDINEEDVKFDYRGRSRESHLKPPSTVEEVLALLADPDASPGRRGAACRGVSWAACDESARSRLRDAFLTHPEPSVRGEAYRPFRQWQDVDALVALATDPHPTVCRRAVWGLREMPPCPDFVPVMRTLLAREDHVVGHGDELIDAYARHAPPGEVVPYLAAVAADRGRREGVRSAAIHELWRLRAAAELAALAWVLTEPPPLTWRLHIVLLGAFADLGIAPPDLATLRAIDHLGLQEALAPFAG
jgi:HEAT repeat protein